MTGRPRGAAKRPDSYRIGGYGVRTKSEIWLDNAAALYEESRQRQWSSATDIPWHTSEPLPDDIERAQCQLDTFLTEVEFVAADIRARWVATTSPDYFEPRMFLLSQIMDESRHLESPQARPRQRRRPYAAPRHHHQRRGRQHRPLSRVHRDVLPPSHIR